MRHIAGEKFSISLRENGSLIEKYSGEKGVNVGNKIIRGEQGMQYSARQDNLGQVTYPNMPAFNFGTEPFSIACLFKRRGYEHIGIYYNTVFSTGTHNVIGIGLQYHDPDYLEFVIDNPSGSIEIQVCNYDINDGLYHVAILEYDGTEYRTYLDNNIYATIALALIVDSPENFHIGRDGATNSNSNSDVVYIKAYDHALTQAEKDILEEDRLNPIIPHRITEGRVLQATDLSHKDYVAAFNGNYLNNQDGEWVDVTQDGNTGTIVGATQVDGGLRSNGNGKDGHVTFATPIFNDATVWGIKFRFKDYVSGAIDFLFGGLYNKNIALKTGGGLSFKDETDTYTVFPSLSSSLYIKLETDLVLTSDGTNIYAYLNGMYIEYITPADTKIYINSILQGYSSNLYTPLITLKDVIFTNYFIEQAEATKYHNDFTYPTKIERFDLLGSDEIIKNIRDYSGTSAGKIGEISTHVNRDIHVGISYYEFTTAGTLVMPHNLDSYVNNGYISYWYYDGSTWTKREGLVDSPVSGASYANKKLTFTGASIGDRIALITVWNQVNQ